MARISPSTDLGDVRDADIVVEAVFERMDVKQELFRKLDGIAKPGAILATNTSTLDVNQIASATKRPQDVVGTHFFSPANVMRLLEVVRGDKTAKDVLATTMKLGKTRKKVPVVSGVCDGFIGNRMVEKYVQQSLLLLDQGATPQQIDGALAKWGMAMGPFTMYDMAGNDIGWEIRKRRAKERPDFVYGKFADRIAEKGWYGQKTGRGWYRYEGGSRRPIADAEVERMLADYRREMGHTPPYRSRCGSALAGSALRGGSRRAASSARCSPISTSSACGSASRMRRTTATAGSRIRSCSPPRWRSLARACAGGSAPPSSPR